LPWASRKPGHVKHRLSVITQRGKKTIGGEHETRLLGWLRAKMK
jgi:hypothetical protein